MQTIEIKPQGLATGSVKHEAFYHFVKAALEAEAAIEQRKALLEQAKEMPHEKAA